MPETMRSTWSILDSEAILGNFGVIRALWCQLGLFQWQGLVKMVVVCNGAGNLGI